MTAANQNVTLTFAYDARVLRTNVTDSRFKQAILYTHDRAGHLKTMTNLAGGVTAYTRNAAGQLMQITGQSGEVFQMQYDARGRRSKITLPNGIAGRYSYDALGRLAGLMYTNSAGTLIAQAMYTYDALANRTSATDGSGAHQ